MTLFHREGGRCVAILGEDEAQVLRRFVGELLFMLSDEEIDHDDPVIARLFPAGYRGDLEAATEFRHFTEADLKTGKVDSIGAVLAALPEEGSAEIALDDEGCDAWLRALTDMRLALGTRLGVTDDTVLEDELDEAVLRHPTSPRVFHLCVYGYLAVLQESLLAAVIGESFVADATPADAAVSDPDG
jgi:hypothetical protein